MTYVLGLTGSIGMGKSTTATMFAQEGIPIWDADAVVHCLYQSGGAAGRALAAEFPQAVENDVISRPALRAIIAADPSALARVEALVHPLVAADRRQFLAAQTAQTAQIVLLDIPLLFETGAEADCDGTVVVTAPADTQRARVLSRPGMSTADLDQILSRQMPDAEKRVRATWVIETTTLDSARTAVQRIITEIRRKAAHA